MERKHLVIVAIYFPPIISIASQRILAFARYFSREYFKVTLITLDTGEPYRGPELPETEIIRLKNDRFFNRINLGRKYPYVLHKAGAAYNKLLDLLVMDEYAGWTREAAKTLRLLHSKDKVDIVLSSFAPAAAHLAVLQSDLPSQEVRWIADMRDEMSLNPFYNSTKQRYFARIEQRIFSKAWMLTTTSDVFLENFRSLGKKSQARFLQIKNGFDFDFPGQYHYNPVFTITHAGTFYGDIKPHTFFKAVSELLREQAIDDIRINLIGAGSAFIIPAELREKVHLTGRIVHKEAVKFMADADVNLIIMPKAKKGTLPGKMYEYLGVLKPIVALMDPKEQAADIIRRANAGFVAGFDEIVDIKEIVMKAYELWKNKERLPVDVEYISQFQRKYQVELLQETIIRSINDGE